MTAIDDYRSTLWCLISLYDVKNVLEIGVEKGISTNAFCEAGCKVVGVDIQDLGYRHKNLTFVKSDASTFIENMDTDQIFDMIFLDAFYTYERLEKDIPLLWRHLKMDGILVLNEYIDFANHRNGEIRRFVDKWANKYMLPFVVYPLRNGQVVFVKNDSNNNRILK